MWIPGRITNYLINENNMENEITINGKQYILKSDRLPAQELDGLKYCIVRTYSAGVFAGYLQKRKGKEGTVLRARRLWRWSGAASLSQLAVDGVANPNDCKFPCEVESVDLTEIIEVIPCTQKALESINSTPIWQM